MAADNKGFSHQQDFPREFRKGKKDIPPGRDGSSEKEAAYAKPSWRERYRRALKVLIPIRKAEKNNKLPLNDLGFLSWISVNWISSIMAKASKEGLFTEDLLELDTKDAADKNTRRLEYYWNIEVSKWEALKKLDPSKDLDPPSLSRAVWNFGKTRFLLAMALIILTMFFQFAGPSLILNALLTFISDPDQPFTRGIIILVLLFMCQLMRTLTFSASQNVGVHTGIRVLAALEGMGYKKLLRLSSPNDAVLGQFLTFLSSDHVRITEAVLNGPLFIGTPIMFMMAIGYSIYLIGPPAIAGSVVILLFYPIMGLNATVMTLLREKVVGITDARVTMMGEVLNSMRLIKMYAWEQPFIQRIIQLRDREVSQLKKANFCQSVMSTVSPSITIIAGFTTFLLLTSIGVGMTSAQAFIVLSVFNAMQFSVSTLPYSLKCITEAKVGFDRLQRVLLLKEHSPQQSKSRNVEEAGTVVFQAASLAWDIMEVNPEKEIKSKNKFEKKNIEKKTTLREVAFSLISDPARCLYNINLKVGKGELLGVAGEVGSGKTSLISAIMGELTVDVGSVTANGSLALVSQQAWIFNGTIRDNIILGSPLREDWYNTVIYACALQSDLKMLNNGDLTVVGERGVTLSGGQRQRVNLARALYADRDIYLLDDPLSAVDSSVGDHIFKNYIQDILKDKTVILVSHGIQFLSDCDSVVFLENGRIIEKGTHKELLDIPGGRYKHIADFDAQREQKSGKKKRTRTVSVRSEREEEEMEDEVLNVEEKTTNKGWGALLIYFKACGGYALMTFIGMFVALFILARLATNIWLQIWMDMGDGLEEQRRANLSTSADIILEHLSSDELAGSILDNPKLWLNQLTYGLIIVAMLTFGVIKGIGLSVTLLRGSAHLHDNMLTCVLNSPISFFDTTPSGRIINRFSKDMDDLDVRIPMFTELLMQYGMMLFSQVLLVCFLYPYFTIAFVIIFAVFILIDRQMNHGVLETKKLDNLTKSPVLHHVTSSVAGISVIRGFNKEKIFEDRFYSFLNKHLVADSLFNLATRWFMLRMEILSLLIITSTGIVILATKGSVSPSIAGLAMTNLFAFGTMIPFVMKVKSEYRARVNSIERIAEYHALEQEAPHYIEGTKPQASWPQSGSIRMDEVSFRYRPELPLVLRGISVEMKGGARVGIVGRTGAGKSSLISTLLRLVELDAGTIYIDELDISVLGLAALRSAIAVIPQDPVLFQGTIRYNLDPFDKHSDEEVWGALEAANLKEKVGTEGKQLSMLVEAEGENFSVGEKQLICLARALLRRNRILLLDEATASVDMKTDHLIQNTIKSAFKGCTILTIAHRLTTVIDYDKILVLDQGALVECGTPADLMAFNGIFAGMVKASGIYTAIKKFSRQPID